MKYKKLAQATGKTPEQVMREMYEKGLISKEEDLRIRLSEMKFGHYDATLKESFEVSNKKAQENENNARLSYK